MKCPPISVVCQLIAVAAASFLAHPASRGVEPPRATVTARLVADADAVRPGQPFTVGLFLDLAPGWHVYWTNPGDAGLPTRLTLRLPPGFRADAVQFPAPARFATGEGVSFGYAESVLLTARVHPPGDWKPTDSIKITASAQWMACRQVCIPGRAELDLEIPAAAGPPRPANEALFKRWAERMPVDVAASPDVAKVEWATDPAAREATAVVTWRSGAGAVKDVELYPLPDDALDVTTTAQTDGRQTRLDARVRVLAGQTPKTDRLPAVIAYTDRAGVRCGVKAILPLPLTLSPVQK